MNISVLLFCLLCVVAIVIIFSYPLFYIIKFNYILGIRGATEQKWYIESKRKIRRQLETIDAFYFECHTQIMGLNCLKLIENHLKTFLLKKGKGYFVKIQKSDDDDDELKIILFFWNKKNLNCCAFKGLIEKSYYDSLLNSYKIACYASSKEENILTCLCIISSALYDGISNYYYGKEINNIKTKLQNIYEKAPISLEKLE